MKRKDLIERTYTHRATRITLHIIFWILMFASYYYFNTISFNPAQGTAATYLLAAKNAIVFAAAFYLLMYWIWPKYIARKSWVKSLLLLLVWLVAITALDAWADQLIFTRCDSCGQRLKDHYSDYYYFLQRDFPGIVLVRVVTGGLLYHLIIQLSFPVAIKIGRDYFRQTVQQLQLSRENLQLEFNFLKAQVNPHFLFNTLNNIYSLVLSERKEQAANTIARLSGLMRYTLYETGDEKIPLQKEIKLLKDYVQLEQLRLNETEVQFHFTTDREDYSIPPLLFMPALENAFKYTADKKGNKILVTITAENNMLAVTIENNVDLARAGEQGGIGLTNLRKRLLHYYPGSVYSAALRNDIYLFELTCKL